MNEFIFGRDQTERITSVEVKHDKLYLYKTDGSVQTKPHKHWMLLSESLGSKTKRLDGDLHFKYLLDLKFKRDLFDIRKQCEQDNIDYKIFYDDTEAAMIRYGITSFKGLKFNDISVLAFDIEAMNLEQNKDSKVLCIANTYRDRKGNIVKKLFSEDEFETQNQMIDAWCDWVREIDPDIMCGHNIFMYDLPYIQHCRKSPLRLGRDGSNMTIDHWNSYFRKDQSQTITYKNCRIFGREIIDTFFSSIKYDTAVRSFSKEGKYISYALKQIIAQEGLEVENRTFYPADQIARNWHNPIERAKIKSYAADDGDDALSLFDLQMPSFFYYAQSIPKRFQAINNSASGSQINAFLVRGYLQQMHSIPKASNKMKFEGAISFSIPGVYKNVFSVDFSSLYPSIIRQYKIYDKEKDPLGYFLNMVDYFTEERLDNKRKGKETGKKYFKDTEQSQKIIINSSFGMLGTSGLNFNSPKNAALITKIGRDLLDKICVCSTGKDTLYWRQQIEK